MTSCSYGHPLRPQAAPGPQAGSEGQPVFHARRGDGAYARLLAAMRALTDIEPDATFADQAVLIEGEQLVRHLQERVRKATGRHLSPQTQRPDDHG